MFFRRHQELLRRMDILEGKVERQQCEIDRQQTQIDLLMKETTVLNLSTNDYAEMLKENGMDAEADLLFRMKASYERKLARFIRNVRRRVADNKE